MKLSEKIVYLRREKNLTQEELAEFCGVSRQSVSKWEADIALPEVDKLLLLGKLFGVTLDTLLKDECAVDGIREVHTCGENAVKGKQPELYEGVLIKESIEDENILDLLNVHQIELWNTGGKPKYWTVLYFTSAVPDFPQRISGAIQAEDNWFVDFKARNQKYIVFRNQILSYRIGDQAEKDMVCAECRKNGISDDQMHWSE